MSAIQESINELCERMSKSNNDILNLEMKYTQLLSLYFNILNECNKVKTDYRELKKYINKLEKDINNKNKEIIELKRIKIHNVTT